MWCRSCDNASPWKITDRKTKSGHRCSKNDSLIWNKIRAQLHGSVHPTHSVTLRGEREQEKSTSKITVCSAQNQERLKKTNMERQTKVLLSVTSRCPCSLPSWPRMWPQGHAFLPPSWALPPPHLPHLLQPAWRSEGPVTYWATRPGEVSVGADLAEQRGVWRRSPCWVCHLWLSEGREHRQDVLVIIMAPVEISAVQSFRSFETSNRI